MIVHSATLEANERIQARIRAGERVVHLAFGEAGLPVPDAVAAALAAGAPRNAYGPVAGDAEVRRAAAGYLGRRGLPTDPSRIVVGPGSKALLFGLLSVLPGDVVLPAPSWVSYAAQAALAGKATIWAPTGPGWGGVPDPGALGEALAQARRAGRDPRILVLTLPDNPTGTVAPASAIEAVCAVAEANGLQIVSDEIYRDLAYAPEQVRSPAELVPERTYVTGGLSKSMALGGWRFGFARLPDGETGRDAAAALIGLASEVWSCVAGPVEAAAAYVLDEPAEVVAHVNAARLLHRRVSEAAYARVTASGTLARAPQAAFYLYPDLAPHADALASLGVHDGDGLGTLLLERFGVGVLPGACFGDDPAALRFRMATSLLYGATPEQRWQALTSDDPAALPWIAGALDTLGDALASIARAELPVTA